MRKTIKEILVKNNEDESAKLILKYLDSQEIIYVKNQSSHIENKLNPIEYKRPAIMLQSSGSMQIPKKCIHTIDNLNNSAKYSGLWLKELGFEIENCLIFNTLPLNHISGFMPLWRSRKWKCRYIPISPKLIKKTKDLLAKTIAIKDIKEKTLITSLVPTQLKRLLLDSDGILWLKLFDIIWVGGASIPSKISTQCRHEEIKLSPCYGSTETTAMISCLKPIDFLNGNNTSGEILKDVKIKISNKGLININTKRIGVEYTNSSRLKDFRNDMGWWESSDLGKIIEIDQRYFLNVFGRADNAFQSGGETIFPDLIKKKFEEIILLEKLPIYNLTITKIKDDIWENRFEIILNFKNTILDKDIKSSLKILEKYYQNWPSSERPKNMKVSNNDYEVNDKNKRDWKNIQPN